MLCVLLPNVGQRFFLAIFGNLEATEKPWLFYVTLASGTFCLNAHLILRISLSDTDTTESTNTKPANAFDVF